MKKQLMCGITATALVASGLLAGCETTGQSTGLGALVGAGVGYAVGGEKGALIGAAVGAGAGFAAHKIKERRTRTAQQTAAEYNYAPDQGLKVDLRPTTLVSPSTVPVGNTMNAEMEYAILGAGTTGAEVHEKQLINKDGQLHGTLLDRKIVREDGTWIVTNPIQITDEVAPGNYELNQNVQVADLSYSKTTPFTVTEKTASAERMVIVGEPRFTVAAR